MSTLLQPPPCSVKGLAKGRLHSLDLAVERAPRSRISFVLVTLDGSPSASLSTCLHEIKSREARHNTHAERVDTKRHRLVDIGAACAATTCAWLACLGRVLAQHVVALGPFKW